MAISKIMLTKIAEKTEGKDAQRGFIIKILEEENKGIGWYKDFYKNELKKAIVED